MNFEEMDVDVYKRSASPHAHLAASEVKQLPGEPLIQYIPRYSIMIQR